MAGESNVVISLFGQKGSGKTTLAQAIIEEHDRVIALDVMGQYDTLAVRYDYDACAAALLAAAKQPTFGYSLRCSDHEDYLDLMELCFELTDYLLVLEETSMFCSPSSFPREMSRLVRYGRHRQIDQIYIARRPAEIPRDLTANSDLIVSYFQQEPIDVKYLSAVSGEDASRVRNLRQYRCAVWGNLAKAPVAVIAAMDRGGEQVKMNLSVRDGSEPEPSRPPAEKTGLTDDPSEA
jgi:hypothetical protein